MPRGAIETPLDFTLSGPQYEVYESRARFKVLIAGRRFGKTFFALLMLLLSALETPGAICWYVAPSYRMAKDIAWDTLKLLVDLLPSRAVRKVHEGELSIRLWNGSILALKGADNPDSLRGRRLTMVVFDEFAWIDKRAWTHAIRPAISDAQGNALFITTPDGFNWAYDLFLLGQSRDESPEWESWQFTTLQGGRVPPEEVEAARNTLDAKTFRQEYEASFEALAGRIYDRFTRQTWPLGNMSDALVMDDGPILVGMDFNVNPMSAVIGQRQRVNGLTVCAVLDALEIPSSNTDETAREIRRRWGTVRLDDGREAMRRVIVCPDTSGANRSTRSPFGETDITLLQRAGFEVHMNGTNPPVVDRINNVQSMLCAADGTRRLLVHPRAQSLVRGLEGMTYREGTSEPNKTLGLDHITDALGYLCWMEFNLLRDRAMRTRHVAL